MSVEPVETDPGEPEAQPARPRSNAPPVAWSIHMGMAIRSFTRLPNGGVVLHFTACAVVPGGGPLGGGMTLPMPPRIDIPFSPEGWAEFQREVAAGGQVSEIAVARDVPRLVS